MVAGGAGNDVLSGGADRDLLYGEAGLDVIFGDGGDDFLVGGADRDWLYAGAGSDVLFGDAGDDLLGGDGADAIFGEGGNDNIYGEAGNDYVVGGAGYNLISLGAGLDIVQSTNSDAGTQYVYDFSITEGDQIWLVGSPYASTAAARAAAVQVGGDIYIGNGASAKAGTTGRSRISRPISDRHEPQLVPAFTARPTASTVVQPPAEMASAISLRPTSKHAQTMGPRSRTDAPGRPASKRSRSAPM